MAISVVNGFLCFSSCDAAKAATGQNPHPRADVASQYSADTSRLDGPAVILGGTLKAPGSDGVTATGANQPNDATTLWNQSTPTDILA
jgi:hypothetical protein